MECRQMSTLSELLKSDEERGSEEHRAWLRRVRIEADRFYLAKAQKMAGRLLHPSDLPTFQGESHQAPAGIAESELSKPPLGLDI